MIFSYANSVFIVWRLKKKANCEDSQPHLKQIANGSIILPLIGRLTDGNEIQILLMLPHQIVCLYNLANSGRLSNAILD